MDRKVLKQRARTVLKSHYWIIVMMMAFTSFIGVEYASSFGNLKNAISKDVDEESTALSATILDERFGGFIDIARYISNGFGTKEVWESTRKINENLQNSENKILDTITDTINGKNIGDGILDGKNAIVDGVDGIKNNLTNIKDKVTEEAQTIHDENAEATYLGPVEVGKTEGVLAKIANALTTGRFINKVFTGIATVFRSDDIAAIILIILILLVATFIWSFIARNLLVIVRRFALEARTYEIIPIRRAFFLTRSGRWFNVAWVLFSTSAITCVWALTIVGGVIRYYRYIMVPYIMAENPSITGREARKLSTDMMEGHKLEAFKLEASFYGWRLLSLFTFGILDLLYVNAYQNLTFAEYYSELRLEIKKRKKSFPEAELLNDRFLYIKADDEHIDEAYADIKALSEEQLEIPQKLHGIGGFFARNFGIVLFANKDEAKLCEYEEHQQKVKTRKDVFEKRIYPFRLFPAYRKTMLNTLKPQKIGYLHYVRRYSIWSVILMFFIFSFIGWLWEMSIHLYEDGVFVNRGFLKGPYLPIYGGGSVVILMILNKLRSKPLLEFISIIFLSGIIEYGTAVILESVYDSKWWDYSGYFLNIGGKICLEGLLVFAVFGCFMVYFLAPVTDNLLRKIRLKVIAPIAITLLVVFLADIIYSVNNPNKGAGITDYPTVKQNAATE